MEQPQPSAGSPSNAPVAKKSSKEKLVQKPKKPAAPKKPTYSKMIMDAVVQMKERKGSSRQAISALVAKENSLEVTPIFNRSINRALRTMVDGDSLKQASGIGANGRFRVNNEKLKQERKEVKAKLQASASKTKGAAGRKKVVRKAKKTLKGKKKVASRRARKSPVKRSKAKTVKRKPAVKKRKSAKKTSRRYSR